MLRSASLTAFLATTNAKRCRKCYGEMLGLKLVSEDTFALVFDAGGVPLRIQKVEALTPHPFTALGWHVKNIRRTITALSKRRVRFERYAFLEQDEQGIWLAPSGTRVAWFKDPDGNWLSIAQH